MWGETEKKGKRNGRGEREREREREREEMPMSAQSIPLQKKRMKALIMQHEERGRTIKAL